MKNKIPAQNNDDYDDSPDKLVKWLGILSPLLAVGILYLLCLLVKKSLLPIITELWTVVSSSGLQVAGTLFLCFVYLLITRL